MEMSYEEHVNLSIQWNRWLLKPIGLWPCSLDVSAVEKSFYRMLNVICYGLIGFLLIPCGLYSALEAERGYDALRLVGPMSFCAMGIMKYYALISHGKDIRECVERIEWDWRNAKHVDDRDVMARNAKFGRKMVIVCAFFMYGGFVFFYVFSPLSMGKVVSEDENLTFIPVVFPVYKRIIDTRRSPANEIVFLIQFLAGMVMHGIGAAACSLAAAFAMHVNGQMEVLMCWLKHLMNGRENMSDTVDGRLVDIVRQHMRILKFVKIDFLIL